MLVALASVLNAQEKYFSDPLRIPMLLSGSFAELRSNHFHSGIDIKTQGVTGLPVYAAANGYVSRIAVSPTGFGRALYIDHPNGTTTVYGHLDRFIPEIQEYVIEQQYRQQSFRVDLQVPAYLFSVEKGQEIAKSGNTGSSGGPHLHFEVRDTKTEEPLNPLQYGFSITDKIAPKVFSLLVVPLTDTSQVNFAQVARSYPVVLYDGKYHLKNNPVIPVYGKVGFAIQANDYFDGTYNKCGINNLRLSVDGETQFTYQLNRFAFPDTRYVNSHFDYKEYKRSKRRFIKTWIDPGNRLSIYNYNLSQGMYEAGHGMHEVSILLADTYDNESELLFSIERKKAVLAPRKHEGIPMFYNRDNKFESNDCSIEIPKGALYKNIFFTYSTRPTTEAFYSDFQLVGDQSVPLHTSGKLWIKTRNLPEKLHSKVVMVNVDNDKGLPVAAGGSFENDGVVASVRSLGMYAVMVDTLAPEIIPLSITENTLTESNRIRFRIKDDLSGIQSIEGLLDGKWALFDYDTKTGKITHVFDKSRFDFEKRHSIELTVTDYRENKSVYEATFWK